MTRARTCNEYCNNVNSSDLSDIHTCTEDDCKFLTEKYFFILLNRSQVIQNLRRGVYGHLAVRHVVTVIRQERGPVLHTATLLIQVIYRVLISVMKLIVSCS